jgi:cytochrome o ubiquinol oxidase subunit 2
MWSARSVWAILVPLALEGCHTAVLSPAGPIGAADRTILLDALAIMLAIVVPTILATLAFAWWFRASNTRARHLPTWSYSGRMELIVWSIPALVVFFLGGIAWIGSHLLDPARPLSSGAKPLGHIRNEAVAFWLRRLRQIQERARNLLIYWLPGTDALIKR